MRVLFCGLEFYSGVGGIQQFNRRVATCLAEFRSTVVLSASILSLWDTRQSAREAPEGVVFVPCGRNKVSMLLRFAWAVLRDKPEIILYGHVLLTPLAIIARSLSRNVRQVLFVHGVEVWESPSLFQRKIITKFIQAILSVSRFTADRMQRAYRVDQERFWILPNAIDLKKNGRANSSSALGLAGKHRLLTVSRLEDSYKGHDRVIQSLKYVLSEYPDTHYYVVGEGPLADKLKDFSRQSHTAENVHFLGYLSEEDLNAVYKSSHIFVMPSKGEGFGIVYLEAWKHKIPVIASNQDAAIEVIQHGWNGLLVDPDNPQEISDAVLSLLRDAKLRSMLAETGHKTVCEKYTQAQFRKTLAEILVSIAKIRPGLASAKSRHVHTNPMDLCRDPRSKVGE